MIKSRVLKLLLSILLFSGVLLWPLDAQISKAAVNTQNIPVDKEWRIKFNLALDAGSLQNNILLRRADTSDTFPITPVLDPNDSSIVIVKHSTPFTPGASYELSVNEGIKSSSGKLLSGPASLTFTCAGTANVPVTNLSLNRTDMEMEIGAAETLTAIITPSNATNKDVTWKSSNTGIAAVDSMGNVTAISPGTATITAETGNNLSASCVVTVSTKASAEILPTSISISKDTLTLTVNTNEQLSAAVNPSNATNKEVTWTTSNPTVALVDASTGFVQAKSPGTAVIIAVTTAGNKTAVCNVTVVQLSAPAPAANAQPVVSVTIDHTSEWLESGMTHALNATVNPADAANKAVTWSSSNNSVATVDSKGVVTAVSPGVAIITVKTADGDKTATSTIKVNTAKQSMWKRHAAWVN